MSSDLSLQERLVRYFEKRPNEPIAKGFLCDLAREKMGVLGETVGRRLRVLEEVSSGEPEDATKTEEHIAADRLLMGGKVTVSYDAKGNAEYTYTPPSTRRVRKIRIEGDRAIEYYETITV